MADFSIPKGNHAYRTAGDMFRNPGGPQDSAGRLIDVSDRPLLCSSTNMRNEVIVGGSDHALYAIDVTDSRRRPVTMYTKTAGHTDWVTSVCHLPSGQVLSGAMDGKLCLWSAQNRQSCIDLSRGSTHPIAKVVSDTRYDSAIALSYDGNIEVYTFSGDEVPSTVRKASNIRSGSASTSTQLTTISSNRISPRAVLTGHSQPVLECSYHQRFLATGDKSGSLMLWDLNEGKALSRFRAHPGAITNIHCGEEGSIIITAGTDGFVKIWDPRSNEGSGLVRKIPAHVQAINPAPVVPRRAAPSNNTSSISGGRGMQGSGRTSSQSSSSCSPAPPQGAPISTMSVVYSRGSSSDVNYIVTGGGSATDSRLCVLDARQSFTPVAYWDHHRNGIYSMCIVGDDVVLSGDGVGNLLCHHLLSESLDEPRDCLKYGLGASSAGAVRSINCLNGKVVTAGEDGKVIVFDYEESVVMHKK